MATIIKLQRKGTTHKPFWHIVVTDERKPKDCVELLGTYDNLHKPVTVRLNKEKTAKWLSLGATPTDSVRTILKNEGVLNPKLAAAKDK